MTTHVQDKPKPAPSSQAITADAPVSPVVRDAAAEGGAPPKGGALALAIKLELQAELEQRDYVDLKQLAKIEEIAYHGRMLVAVRNPVMRFQGRVLDEEAADPMGGGMMGPPPDVLYGGGPFGPFGYAINPADPDEDDFTALGEWARGPVGKQLRKQRAEAYQSLFADSPLAAAIHRELVEVVAKSQGAMRPAEFLEVEQLAKRGYAVLAARCGMDPSRRRGRRRRKAVPWAGASSAETFGAAAIRALGAQGPATEPQSKVEIVKAIAAAKEARLDDVATQPRGQLSAPAALPSPTETTPPETKNEV